MQAFGTKLVVFADSEGELKVLDAYCRHMGGDLSEGTIKGDEVACPFHDWRWGGDGRCKLVPYAKRTPKTARTRAWATDVRGGLLFVWHDHEGNPPDPAVQIPDIPEAHSDEWTEWRWNRILIEGSNCRDIIDNVTDMAHFFTSISGCRRTSRTSSRATSPRSTCTTSAGLTSTTWGPPTARPIWIPRRPTSGHRS